jgi:hypothetical protein
MSERPSNDQTTEEYIWLEPSGDALVLNAEFEPTDIVIDGRQYPYVTDDTYIMEVPAS